MLSSVSSPLVLGGIVRGARVHLRTTTEDDLADHIRWHADPETTKWMPERPRPQSPQQRRDWLRETAKGQREIHWEISAGEAHVGYCGVTLHGAPFSEGWAFTHLFIAPDARRNGLGSEAARIAHRYLVTYLGLRVGDVRLYYDDAVGRRIFESLGYREIGHGRDAFYHSGRYWDEWYGLVRAEEFRARHPEREYPERTED